MKRFLLALGLFLALGASALAQTGPAHTLPIFRGPNVQGFNNTGAGTSGQVLTSNGAAADPSWQAGGGGGSGTVTSVGLSAPSEFSVSGSPVTTTGTLTFSWANPVSVAHGGTGLASGTSGGIPYYSGSTTIASSGALSANQIVLGGGAGLAPSVLASLGTTTTVLHGNAAGAPTFAAVGPSDLSLTPTTCTNQFITAISSTAVGTCTTDTLASAQHANQGTTTTLLHGNAAGNPSWAAVANADLVNAATTVNGQTCTLGSTCTVTAAATGVTVGTTTVSSGTNGRVLYDNSGVLGELANTGSGNNVLATAPTFATSINVSGLSTGTASIVPQSAAGTPTLTLPTGTGTFAVSATSPVVLSATTGTLTCPTCATSSGGGAITGTAPVAVSAAGVVSITGAAGQVLAGASPAFTATPTLGVAGSTLGTVTLAGSTSGTTVLQPNVAASGTLTLPAATDTLVAKATTDTLTNKTLSSPILSGTVSGANTIPLSILAQSASNTMLGNWTGSTANVLANSMPSCSDSGGNHLNYVSGTGVTCGTSGGVPSGSAGGDLSGTYPNPTVAKANGISMPASVTSGGIPYYSSSSVMASSAALTANAAVKGGGAGAAPTASGVLIDSSNNVTGINTETNNAGQTISTSPTGNPTGGSLLTTYSSLAMQGTTVKSGNREYLANFGLTSNQGSAATNNNQDKVTLYTGMVAQSGTGDVWSYNPLLTMNASSGSYNAQGIELDFNNNNADRGSADGGTGLAAPIAYGQTISGAGSFQSTAAFGISGPGSAIWHRGIVIANSSVSDASFQELGVATISLDIRGTHTYGADFSTMAGIPIRIANNNGIYSRNAAGSADVQLIKLNGSDKITVGSGVTVDSSNNIGAVGLNLSGMTASLPVATDSSKNLISVSAHDAALLGQTCYAIDQSAAGSSITGTTSETVLKTVAIPANAIGANGRVEIESSWSTTSSANTKTQRTRFGASGAGTGGTVYNTVAVTTSASMYNISGLANRNATNSQVGNMAIGGGNNGGGTGISGSALVTSAVDTTAASEIDFTGQLTNTGETVTLEAYKVSICPKN